MSQPGAAAGSDKPRKQKKDKAKKAEKEAAALAAAAAAPPAKRKQPEQDSDSDLHFYSPAASPAQQGAHKQQQQQQRRRQQADVLPRRPAAPQQRAQHPAPPAPVRVELTILPSPARAPKRGKRAPALSPDAAAAAAALGVPSSWPRTAAAGGGSKAAATAGAGLPPAAAPPPKAVRKQAVKQNKAASSAPQAAAPAAGTGTAAPAAPAAPAAAAAAAQAAASLAAASAAGQPDKEGQGNEKKGAEKQVKRQRKGSKRERKTLTAKGKRAAVLAVLADVELSRAASGGGTPCSPAAAGRGPGMPGQQAHEPQQQQQQQQQQQLQEAVVDAAATANLGRAWSKADIGSLTRLAEDRAFLLATIPQHPAEGELDWGLISRHFGRYSQGGWAVRQQYLSVQRLVKAARHEGRRGVSYVDLVRSVLAALPGRRGTVYEIQALLKRDHASSLDKYRTKGVLRWKAAVGEVLREQSSLFQQVDKTATGKIVWQLSEPQQ